MLARVGQCSENDIFRVQYAHGGGGYSSQNSGQGPAPCITAGALRNDFKAPLLYQMKQFERGPGWPLLTDFPLLHRRYAGIE